MDGKIEIYCKTMGKTFRVRHIARSVEDANDYCRDNPCTGVIVEDKGGLVYIADLKEIIGGIKKEDA